MATQRFFGPGGLARYLGISEVRTRQISPEPDALIDGRPAWSPDTAARLKLEIEARRAERQAGSKRQRAATAGAAA